MNNELDRRVLLGAAGLAGLAAVSAVAKSGPLDPPAGPVAGTGKIIAEVEPRTAINATNTPGTATCNFRIAAAGSYYLTGNVAVSGAGKVGIEVATSGVTIDLNGFQIANALLASGGILSTSANSERITVRNGRFLNFSGRGVDLNVPGVTVEDVTVEACGGGGIRVGVGSRVERCAAVDCGNGTTPADGISCGSQSHVERCIARGCGDDGISVGHSSLVRGCRSDDSGSDGIAGSAAEDYATTVESCTANGNGGDGIIVHQGAIRGCTVTRNGRHGIKSVSRCIIADCIAIANGVGYPEGANIEAQDVLNRLERNLALNGDVGFRVRAGMFRPNILIGNTAGQNTVNWEIASGNVCFVVNAATTGAISGDAGGASPGSTNPWANFTL